VPTKEDKPVVAAKEGAPKDTQAAGQPGAVVANAAGAQASAIAPEKKQK
jgi:hypothetical protein